MASGQAASHDPNPPQPVGALVVLCGLPGAGKTTLCARLVEWLTAVGDDDDGNDDDDKISSSTPPIHPTGKMTRSETYNVTHIDFDAVYEETRTTRDEFVPSEWAAARELSHARVEAALVEGAEDEAEAGSRVNVVLVDDNMYYRSMRRAYFRTACAAGVSFTILHVVADENVCRARNAARLVPVPDAALDAIVDRMEAPDPERFSFEGSTIVVDTSAHDGDGLEGDWSPLLDDLLAAMRVTAVAWEPVVDAAEAAAAAEAARESAVHQTDLAVRAAVAAVMQDPVVTGLPKARRSAVGQNLSALKKALLDEVRAAVGAHAHGSDAGYQGECQWELLGSVSRFEALLASAQSAAEVGSHVGDLFRALADVVVADSLS